MNNKTDARQIESRVALAELAPNVANPTLDKLIQAANYDNTPPFKLDATASPSLVVNVGPSIVPNPSSARNRVSPFIGGAIPSLTSGVVTLPSATGGSITASPGSGATLNCPSGQFVKVLIVVTNAGQLGIFCGTPAGTQAGAAVPSPGAGNMAIGYLQVSNVSGVVQNINQSDIFQVSGLINDIAGGAATLRTKIFTTATSYVLDPSVDDMLVASMGASFNNLTVTFPVPSVALTGRTFYLALNNSGFGGIIQANFSGGATTFTNTIDMRRSNTVVAVFCDGTKWFILNRYEQQNQTPGSAQFIIITTGGTTFASWPSNSGATQPISMTLKYRISGAGVAEIHVENNQGAPTGLGSGGYIFWATPANAVNTAPGFSATDLPQDPNNYSSGNVTFTNAVAVAGPTITGPYTILGFGQISNQTVANGFFHVAKYNDGTRSGICFVIPGATPTLIGSANQGSNFIAGCTFQLTGLGNPTY